MKGKEKIKQVEEIMGMAKGKSENQSAFQNYYYIYNFKQAKFIIEKTQDFTFQVGVGRKGDIYFKFKKTQDVCAAVKIWQDNKRA